MPRVNHVDALWDFLTTRSTRALVKHFRAASLDKALAVLDISEVGPSSSGPAATARECNRAEPERSPPTADLGTAEVGARYFTVKLERGGRVFHRHLVACDELDANRTARASAQSATSVELVREIDRATFERLTK